MRRRQKPFEHLNNPSVTTPSVTVRIRKSHIRQSLLAAGNHWRRALSLDIQLDYSSFSFVEFRSLSSSIPCIPFLNSTTPSPRERITCGSRLPNSNNTTKAIISQWKMLIEPIYNRVGKRGLNRRSGPALDRQLRRLVLGKTHGACT